MNRKIITFITLGLLIIIGIISIIVLKTSTPQISESNLSSELSYSFGIHPSSLNDYIYAKDLGIDFNREEIYFFWEWSDKEKDGNFKFKKANAPPHPNKPQSGGIINYDDEQEKLSKVTDIKIIRNVCPGELRNTQEEKIYEEYVKKLVERYDGDEDLGCTQKKPDCYNLGDNEYPSQSFIRTLEANPVKYWQVCNQVTDTCFGMDCKDNNNYASKYAIVQKLTYLSVKSSCPECQVLIAGDSSKEMYPPVYKALNGKYIDIVDKHFFGEEKDYYKIQEEMAYLKDSLEKSGFSLNKLRFWITETGTYSGKPNDTFLKEDGLPYQSEAQQAQGLLKLYAVAFGEGVEKVLWAWGIEEGFSCHCCIFDYTGLIYDGNIEPKICNSNDPYDLGLGVKKLAYYSLKMMIEKISSFDNIEIIQDSGNYVYKFIKDNRPIYIAWNDKGGSITLTNIDSEQIMITKGVPKYETGQQITDYKNAFNIETKTVSKGKVTIILDETPVFIEEK